MIKLIKKMIAIKKDYKEQTKRAKSLPKDYLFVFEKIQKRIWSFASGDGYDMLKIQCELLELFELSAAEGKNVLDVTGTDVVLFCDELLLNTKKWTDSYKKKLNRDIIKNAKKIIN